MPKSIKNEASNKTGDESGPVMDDLRQQATLAADALQKAIFNSANFSSIATDANGVIQIFNVGAERMLGYAAADVVHKITPADIFDPQEIIARATALSFELRETINPGFEVLAFKASRGIEDICELTYIRKDGSRFPALVSVTALRDDENAIIGYLLICTDNTARRQIDEDRLQLDQRLRDQQFYTRSLIESSIDALMATDPQGIITDVNKQMEALTACTRDELIGAPFKNHFTDPERADAGIKKVLAEGKVTNYELTALSRDGKETVVAYNATIIYNRDRRPMGVFAAARDITERKRAEEDSHKAALYTRSLIEASLDPLVTISPAGKITDVNRASEAVTGRTRSELIGSDFSDYFTEPEAARAGYQKVLAKGQVTDYPLAIRHAAGAITEVLYNASVYRNPDGEVEGVFAAARDITERKRAEEDSHKAALYTRSLIEASLDPLVTISPAGKITDVNRASEAVTGRTRSELIDSDFSDYFTEPEAARAGYQKVLAKGQVTDYPLAIRHAAGAITEVLYNASVYRNPDGEVEGVFAAARDITERKRAEERERKHTQIAHINRILQMLTANAPLASVLDIIVRDLQAINPALLCSILLLDNEGKHLRHGAAPSLPDFFNEAIAGVAIGPGVGSCGTAAFTGQRVIVKEIETHAFWTPFRDLARRAGLGACWSQPILSAQGKVIGTFAVYHTQAYQPTAADLQLIEDEAQLAAIAIEKTASEARLQLAASVFTHAREGIVITDAAGSIIDVNATFSLITGYSREEVVGQNPRLLNSGRQTPDFYAAMWEALTDKGHWYGELWNRRKNGEVFAEMLTISAVRDGDGKTQNYVALFTDITLLKEHQDQLERMAHYDALTGLPNRLLLADRLQQGIVQCQRRKHSVAVAYLDLDHFKEINDKYGHAIGDTLLIELSQRMKECLREGDSLARIGGDEFVAILVDLELEQDCYPVLERLLRAAASPVTLRAGVDQDGNPNEAVLQASASIGVTLFPNHGTDADQLLRQADQAMYRAKQAGKNRYYLFDIAQDAAIQTHHDSLEQIRLALNNQEFVLFYQPKVDMKTGAVIGAEALIRWQHPERGLLAPSLFLPIIEDDPLIVALGEWVISSALSQMCNWKTAGLDIPVSVNINARQLQESNFAARLSALLSEYPDLAPNRLELEVLETSALADIGNVSQVMLACQALGVHFALDDFGTGYSSLTYLRRLPAEVLKIDQSFVCDMLNDPNDLAIVKGVVGLAKAFHREVIAEGVETAAHGKLLLSIGCELAQGYGIAKPMPAADLPGWITNWHANALWTA